MTRASKAGFRGAEATSRRLAHDVVIARVFFLLVERRADYALSLEQAAYKPSCSWLIWHDSFAGAGDLCDRIDDKRGQNVGPSARLLEAAKDECSG